MIDPIIQFFEKLVTEFTWRRLLFVLIVVFISAALLFWYETYTGHFRLNKIEREIKLLSQLVDLSERIVKENNSKLTDIFQSITQDLDAYIKHSYEVPYLQPALMKAMAAAFPWVLMILLFLISGNTTKQAIYGTFFIAIPFIMLGAYLPTYSQSWLNYFLYPFGHFAFIVAAVLIWQARKKKP